MNRSFHFLLALLVTLFLTECLSFGDYPSAKLTQMISAKESHGNDMAVGDKKLADKAYGAFQIRQPAVDDVNRKLGTHYKASECLGNRSLSVLIFREYINIYATEEKLGHKPTDADMAGIWNGGPSGWKSSLTIAYRKDVMDKIRKA